MINFDKNCILPERQFGSFTPREIYRLQGVLPELMQEWLVEEYDRQLQVVALTRELLDFLYWQDQQLNPKEQEIVNRLQCLLA
jgi:hypothetical protein